MKKKSSRKNEPAVTTKDIADRTGLSKMTVSRVLNEHPYVSDATRKKVMQAVREMGFRPNTLAKRFFTGKTKLIGVIIPLEYMFSSFYFKELFQGVLECVEDRGYDVLLHNSASKKKPPMEKSLDLVKGKLAEGLLLAAPMTYDTYPLDLARADVPIVVMGETACSDKVNRVVVPNRKSSAEAVQKLIALGHRRIGALTFDTDHVESLERLAGYKDALSAARITFEKELVVSAHYNRREAFHAVHRMVLEQPDVTAFFACNADMALGAAEALKSLGLKVPDAVSLVAFDDCAEMEENQPPISTVRQFPYKIGLAAAGLLLDVVSDESLAAKPQTRVIETQFMDRNSLAAPGRRRGPA